MAKDPISSATTQILRPLLARHGFQRLTNRITARVVDHNILQYVSVRLSSWGSRTFCLNYASFCLFSPQDGLPGSPGGRIFIKHRSPLWSERILFQKAHREFFPGETEEDALSSMSKLCSKLESQAWPFFEKTDSVESFYRHLKKQRWGSEHHRRFELGCCLAHLNNYKKAERELNLAEMLYKHDGREWCEERVRQVQALLTSIKNNAVGSLLEDWRSASIESLKLSPVIETDGG